jgi:transcriptional regulator with XRE-family HTH domain
MGDSHPYRERVAERLRALLRARGTSVRAVEEQLGHGRGYVADALRGQKKLGVEVILEVLAAVRVPPEEFFERPMTTAPAERTKRGKSSSTVDRAPVAPRAAQQQGERATVRALLLLLAARGLLDPDQLEDLQRELSTRESA